MWSYSLSVIWSKKRTTFWIRTFGNNYLTIQKSATLRLGLLHRKKQTINVRHFLTKQWIVSSLWFSAGTKSETMHSSTRRRKLMGKNPTIPPSSHLQNNSCNVYLIEEKHCRCSSLLFMPFWFLPLNQVGQLSVAGTTMCTWD